MSHARLGEIERRLCNMVQPGTVVETDYVKARVRVKVGKNQTAWIPWITSRAGRDRTWQAPEIGEQVIVLSPAGDMAQGYALPAIYKNDYPANGSKATDSRTTFADGAIVEYDREAHAHSVTIPAGGKATVKVGAQAQTEITDSKITHQLGATSKIEITASSIKITCGATVFELTSSGTTLTTPQFTGVQS